MPAAGDLLPFEGRKRSQFPDVGSGNERLLARSGKWHGADSGVLLNLEKNLLQLLHAQEVERIQDLRPVNGDDRDGRALS